MNEHRFDKGSYYGYTSLVLCLCFSRHRVDYRTVVFMAAGAMVFNLIRAIVFVVFI